MHDDKTFITVCASCLRASCWQYIFLCDNWKFANIKQVTIKKLKELNLEHSSYWKTDEELAFE